MLKSSLNRRAVLFLSILCLLFLNLFMALFMIATPVTIHKDLLVLTPGHNHYQQIMKENAESYKKGGVRTERLTSIIVKKLT